MAVWIEKSEILENYHSYFFFWLFEKQEMVHSSYLESVIVIDDYLNSIRGQKNHHIQNLFFDD